MSDYISRADAIEAVCRDCTLERKDKCKAEGYCYEVKNLKALPSADAVQGEWEDKEVFNDTDDDHIVEEWQSARCSVCGKYHTTPYMYYFDNFNFCPNCGARMKGGAE